MLEAGANSPFTQVRVFVAKPVANAVFLPEPEAALSRWQAGVQSLRETPMRSAVLALVAVAALSAVMFPFRDQLGVLNVLLLYLLLTFIPGAELRALAGGAQCRARVS